MEKIEWLGHASFKITEADKTIYIDPWKIENDDNADIVLITHEHFDHCSKEDVRKLSSKDTVIVTTQASAKDLKGVPAKEIRSIKPGDIIDVGDIKIQAVPAYNTNKDFHPKNDGKVGFVIEMKGRRIYHAGDTDNIQEMEALSNIDVALLPVSGTYVMNADEAAEAVKKFRPKKVIPMHYGDIVGSRKDAERFRKLVDCEVEILG